MVPHSRSSRSRAETQDPSQLLANREPLLRRQDHSGMFSSRNDPLGVKPIEIRDVERIENTPLFGGEVQLLGVGLPGETSVPRSNHGDSTRTKGSHRVAIHRVFVDVYLEMAHR